MLWAGDHLELRGALGPSALTIGSFDGFHLGHQLLLRTVRAEAQRRRLAPGLVTFDPHPARTLAPAFSPPLIMPTGRRREAIARAGLEWALLQRFGLDFAAMPPERFAAEVLAASLAARLVVVGDDFTFGRDRAAGVSELAAFGAALGFEVLAVPRLAVQGMIASSTRIRAFLMQGSPEAAAVLLGRPFTLFGPVVAGAGRGRRLGYPTANLACDAELRPASGVYACRAWSPGWPAARLAVANLGRNPTFGPGPWTAEPHVLDWDGDLRGQQLALALVVRLREERTFSSPGELSAQIAEDVELARALAASWPACPAPAPMDGIVLDNMPSSQR
ncbi:MAG TPA: riboflavin biosynthesis protein RibF [Myxococcota bacterium]|nr:riboflavin biosynthesis protein RibF [Myxococcota bacterium]HRY95105.1 riboflavin biosynthesis protein RibF [Myxococcota bacterium]HSA21151.1 riboflavin biosynthesis protein RibF [Myxococcota bacterium]